MTMFFKKIQIHQQADQDNTPSANQPETGFQTYKTGSMWIDPETHQIVRLASDKTIKNSNAIYAVGAMTRGQIIDASMAHGIVQSTAKIAGHWVDFLTQAAI